MVTWKLDSRSRWKPTLWCSIWPCSDDHDGLGIVFGPSQTSFCRSGGDLLGADLPFDPLDGRRPSPGLPRRRTDTSASQQHRLDLLDAVGGHWWATQALLAANSIQSGYDPGADHGALELGEDPEKLEQHPAGWRSGVDGLLMQVEIDATCLHNCQEGHKVLK